MAGHGGPDDAIDDAAESRSDDLPPTGILELEPLYEALGHPRRRYLVYTLLEDTEWTLAELARKVAAWEHDLPEYAVSDDQEESVYVSLYHAHVPKLVEEGVISYEEAAETIRAGENAEQVLIALEGMGASLDGRQERHARGETDE